MKSLSSFGVNRPVPVNLLMAAILIGGIASGWSLRREFFPAQDTESATVSMPYPGASPEELEETLAIKVEDVLADLDEVDELQTRVFEGAGVITVKFREGINVDKAIDEVERTVDALQDLPDESEKLTVTEIEPRLPVIRVAVFGDVDESVLKDTIREVRDELRTLPGMGEITIEGVRDYEVRVDVDQEALVQYGVSLPEVAQRIGQWLNDIPGGTVRSQSGDVKVRTMGVEERERAIREIVLLGEADGRTLRLGEVATVDEGFVDEQVINRFNGQPTAMMTVFRVGKQDIVNMAEMVRAYVAGRNGEPFRASGLERLGIGHRKQAWELGHSSPLPLPAGVQIRYTSDLARFVEGRLDLLTRNATYGAILVFGTLLIFLNWRVALWVGVGLVTAITGTLMLMLSIDVTLNLLTMFGLIVVLGLLVDDAIVVSENIQARHDRGEPALAAAVNGAQQVFWPVVATVMTSVVAFLPLTFVKGNIGDLLGALPLVVACALVMSLIESLIILPSHMGHSLAKRDRSKPSRFIGWVRRGEQMRDRIIHDKVIPAYAAVLEKALRFRYISAAIAIATLTISLGMVASGRLVFTFLPTDDAETILVDVRTPIGSPIGLTDQVVSAIEAAAVAQPEVQTVAATIGAAANIETGTRDSASSDVAQMFIELKPVETRDRDSTKVVDSIRAASADAAAIAEQVTFETIGGGPGGPAITFRVRGPDTDQLLTVASLLKQELASYDGVFDVRDDNDLGQLELQINLKPGAAALGFTVADVATQVRGFLFGIDAHVFADRQEDIDVRVRVDEDARRSLYAIENAWLVSPAGQTVPLIEIADIAESDTFASIRRIDRERSITVLADVADGYSPETVTLALTRAGAGEELSFLDQLRRDHPRVDISFGGRQEQIGDAFSTLPLGFAAACVMIYVILAWLFDSFFQPIVVMLVIPFALIGVIWGHLLLGYEMTFLSLIGFVALSGIVVNDSLILVEFYNKLRLQGENVFDALVQAGRARLRAIMLTTITTVLGLTPLILETSFQARFLIPMAISIAMGLISATVLILIVLPCAMLIFDDIKAAAYFLWHGRTRGVELSPKRTIHA